jgi:hypothetical protein
MRLKYPTTATIVPGEALMTRDDAAGGTLVHWRRADSRLANTRRAWTWRFPDSVRWKPMGYLAPSPLMRATKPLLFLLSCFLKPNAEAHRGAPPCTFGFS